jgi:hypothetical protein
MTDLPLAPPRRIPFRAPDRPREEACVTCAAAAPCRHDGADYCVNCVPGSFWPPESRPSTAKEPTA